MKGTFSSYAFLLLGPVLAAAPHAFPVEAYMLPGRTTLTHLPTSSLGAQTLSHLPDPTLGTGLIFYSDLCLDLWREPHPPPSPLSHATLIWMIPARPAVAFIIGAEDVCFVAPRRLVPSLILLSRPLPKPSSFPCDLHDSPSPLSVRSEASRILRRPTRPFVLFFVDSGASLVLSVFCYLDPTQRHPLKPWRPR
ncbi:uncharacterized protein LY79DRAFT_417232 [Colletotrichum navitas]|uniref:Uncharacterized protein n=1 Tax=Colletotrichum navitas TaxID=681940 RepID=A0AAD8PNL3_9PEZI|nr:uncharacterized protein LY79DRAFT_417232 [Colletotrichum navitas]KAK1573138.1 hypothetical protein LY79DRAFT_417232 [Colletotrichum navitas]